MGSEDKKCAVVLSFDFDAESMWTSLGLTTPTPMSRGEYGARVGVPRILALLEKHDIRATFFVPGDTIRRHEALVKEIHARGHEIGHHGDVHESPAHLAIDDERKILEAGIREIERVTGETPKGYRSPAWDLSPHSVGLFQECGFLYDSSMMGDDFRPYFLKHDGKETDVVELPVSWELDDAPHFLFNFVPYLVGTSAPSKVHEIWAAEFEGAYLSRGVFTLTMHPQISGRYHRVKMLDELIRHIAGHSGVRFATCAEVTADWLTRHKNG
jgi:peptidoglycan/xylan/chitin deacetylase (PgdA/CDA1 family)